MPSGSFCSSPCLNSGIHSVSQAERKAKRKAHSRRRKDDVDLNAEDPGLADPEGARDSKISKVAAAEDEDDSERLGAYQSRAVGLSPFAWLISDVLDCLPWLG